MNKPIISIIVAVDRKRGIGFKNQLLVHLPPDLKHFKEITTGHTIIMGQKTFESIGRALPNRQNIILSDDQNFKADGCQVFGSIEAALDYVQKNEATEAFFIGGASIYRQAIDLADKLYLTLIDKEYQADTYFPDYSMFKNIVSESDWQEHAGTRFRFMELTK